MPNNPLKWGTVLITYYYNCLYDESVLASSRVGSSLMPRKPRYLQLAEDAAYHVLNRGHNHEAIFAHDDDEAAFVAIGNALPSACTTTV